jgi:hypothetical protein
MKKRNLLARLRLSGWYYLAGALLLLVGVPLYQLLVLNPLNYGSTLSARGTKHFATYLAWIGAHTPQFLFYRVLLIVAFALLLTLPFNLFRIIVAQEIVGQQDRAEEKRQQGGQEDEEQDEDEEEIGQDGLPPHAWRGKGFAIIAAWAGLVGLIAYLLGASVGNLYLIIVGHGFTLGTAVPGSFTVLYSIFSLLSNTVGVGLLALSTLFFGAMIARSGRNLWPTSWIFFGYLAIAVTALLSGSAVAIASAPTQGEATLTTPAILLFGVWVVWLGVMLVRLKPE